MSSKETRIAIIIDHSNLRHTWEDSKHLLSKKINYSKLVRYLSDFSEPLYKVVFLNRAVAGNALCHFFDSTGFETLEKKPKEIRISADEIKFKCNLDVDMTIVAMQMVFDRELYPIKPDKIIIVSGDSDFEYLAHTLVGYGIEVEFAFYSTSFAKELCKNFPTRTLENMLIWDKRF